MRHVSIWSCTLVFLCMFTNAVHAVDVVVKMPLGKPFPNVPEREAGPRDRIAFVAFQNYKLKESPDSESGPSGYQCRYMEMLIWMTSYQKPGDTQPNYVLLCIQEGGKYKPLGWALTSVVCGIECNRDDVTKIYKKAFLVNKIDAIQKGGELSVVPIFLAPGYQDDRPKTTPLRLSNVLFVYQEYAEKGQKEKLYLVGTEPKLELTQSAADPSYASRIVLGWVSQDRVFNWNTREVLEFNRENTLPGATPRRTTKASVYKSVIDANRAASGEDVTPVDTEKFDANGTTRLLVNSQMRYPLAKFTDDDKAGEKGFTLIGTGRLFKIGYAGAVIGKDGSVKIGNDEMALLQQRMTAIKEQLATTDILIIVDATSSMEKGMEKAAELVKHVIDDVSKGGTANVRVAVTTYKDFVDELSQTELRAIPVEKRRRDAERQQRADKLLKDDDMNKVVVVRPLVSATEPEAKGYLSYLEKASKPGELTGGGYPLEQVFYGLQAGLDGTKFATHSRKIVITIGDMGDHEPDEDNALAQSVVDRLFQTLDPTEKSLSPCEFYALQVVNPERNDDSKRYRDQMTRICDLFNKQKAERCREQPAAAKLYSLADADRFLSDIKSRYEFLKKRSDELAREMQDVQFGRNDEIIEGSILKEVLAKANIDWNKLKGGTQVFSEVFVFEKANDVQQVRPKFMLLTTECRDLAADVRAVLTHLEGDAEKGGDAAKLQERLIAIITGDGTDTTPQRSLKDRLDKIGGITFRSPLFNNTVDQIKQRNAPGPDLQELQNAKQRLRNLELVRENKKPVWVDPPIIKKMGPFEVKQWTEKGDPIFEDRVFRLPGTLTKAYNWVWIDFETEMP